MVYFLRLDNSEKSDRLNGILGQINGKIDQGRSNVSSYFKRHEVVLTRCHWQVMLHFASTPPYIMTGTILKISYSNLPVIQIIQLIHSPQIGQFFAWVVVDGIMLKIPVSVPRVFYLNSRSPISDEFLGKRVNKTLPHGRQSNNLYEVLLVLLFFF